MKFSLHWKDKGNKSQRDKFLVSDHAIINLEMEFEPMQANSRVML